MLLLEHYPPVYTFGLRQKDYATEAERLEKLGAQVYKVSDTVHVGMQIQSNVSVLLSLFLPFHPPSLPAPGEERRSHHLPWPGTTGLLPHPQHETAQGTLLAMVCIQQ